MSWKKGNGLYYKSSFYNIVFTFLLVVILFFNLTIMMASILLLLHKPFLLPGITDFLCFYFIGYRLSRKSHFTNTKSFNSSVTDNVWARMTRIDTDSSLSFNFTYGHVISLTRRHSVIGMQCIITSEICHMYRHKNMHMAQRSLGRLGFIMKSHCYDAVTIPSQNCIS